MSTRIVLLGGGYVTLHSYTQIVRRLGARVRGGDVEIVIVSADDAHSFHGFTGEVLAGILPFERTRTPLREVCPRARLIHARVVAIDADARTVGYELVADGSRGELGYDHLVVGTGGREPATSVPGLAQHGFLLRGPGDVETLATRLRQASTLGRSLGRATSPLVTSVPARRVVVVGGGLTGVEMAAAVADLGTCSSGGLRVELVHSGDALLPELRACQPRLARRAEAELRRLGVRVRLGVRLAQVTSEGARLSDGTFLRAHTVIGAIGQRAVRIPGLDADLRDESGRLRTDADLRVRDGVWAAGDAALVGHCRTAEPVPTNALWAIKGGAHVGANVARTILGRSTRPFAYRGLGQAASFGLGRSIADLYGVPFTGGVAWALRMAFFLRFMPSRRRTLQVVGDLAAAFGDRRPSPADVLHPTTASLDHARRRRERVARVQVVVTADRGA